LLGSIFKFFRGLTVEFQAIRIVFGVILFGIVAIRANLRRVAFSFSSLGGRITPLSSNYNAIGLSGLSSQESATYGI
jgi:hypothetical protein